MRRLAILALAAGAAVAPQAQVPPFRAATDVIEVDTIVQNKKGQFVDDLKAEDFQVLEDGRPQRVDLFYVVGGAQQMASAAQTDQPVQTAGVAPLGSPRNPRRVFVAVFDDAHLGTPGFKRAKDAATELFTKYFRDADVGGIVWHSQILNHRLTSDRQELFKWLNSITPSAETNSRRMDELTWPRLTEIEGVRIQFNQDRDVLDEAIRRACADDPSLCDQADLAVRGKASMLSSNAQAVSEQTLRILSTLMKGLAGFDGRKSVLLFSEGFITEESWTSVQEAVGLAARADARIYSLDARGTSGKMRDIQDPGPNGAALDTFASLLQQMDFGADSINSLAVDSGGFVVRNLNTLTAAVAKIADEAGHYYVLGYHSDKAPDGKFRKISVKLNRPDVSVRARRGYVATPRPPRPTPTETPPSAAATAAPAQTPTVIEAPVAEGAATTPVTSAEPVVPAETGTVVPQTGTSGTMRLRPDAAKNVARLASHTKEDDFAQAGWEAYQRGDVESARKSLSVAVLSPETEPWVHYALGQADYALRHYPDAVKAWETVRTRVPEFEPVYFDLVDGYLQLRDRDMAIRVLRDAEKRWANDPEVYNAMGVVQTSRGSIDDAVKSFAKAVEKAPNDSIGYFNLGRAYEMLYNKSRRWVPQTRTWVTNQNDRDNAIANYKRYLEFGGPYEESAKAGLTRLEWTPK